MISWLELIHESALSSSSSLILDDDLRSFLMIILEVVCRFGYYLPLLLSFLQQLVVLIVFFSLFWIKAARLFCLFLDGSLFLVVLFLCYLVLMLLVLAMFLVRLGIAMLFSLTTTSLRGFSVCLRRPKPHTHTQTNHTKNKETTEGAERL